MELAAIRRRTGPRATEIAVKVRCWVCDDALPLTESDFSWDGETHGVLDVRIVPICVCCKTQDAATAEKFEQIMHEVRRRNELRLISSDGETDGVARGIGKLRLVEKPRQDEDDDAP